MADLPAGPGGEPAGGRYRVEGRLGGGGGGEVFAAQDTLLNRPVVIKRLPLDLLAPGSDAREAAEAAARLLAEAQALARLVHPHIVAVFDAFEEAGRLHVVMERLEGPTLRRRLDERGPLALDELARLAAHLAEALAHAHAQGVVHRDLKPANVLLAPGGAPGAGWTAKLIDFGIARAADAVRLTLRGMAVGTPAYVAPEQALGQPVDGRADLYGLGCVLYEAATGAPPFAGDDPLLVVSQHLHAEPAPPSARRPGLPPAWDALLLRLLAKRPEDRPPSAAALLAELAAWGAAGAPPAGPGPRHNLPRPLTSFVGREREQAEVKRLLAVAPLLTLVGVGGTGKTRLALRVAADVLAEYPDGVWLVELAPLADPALVPQALAAAVGVREAPGRPLLATLADALKARRLLVLLDNCEHLLDACARLADALLRACPRVRLLATSREALGIAGETPWRVPPLSLPAAGRGARAETLTRYEAVRLFVERAVTVQPAFAVTARNAPAVARLCRRLDGIPLALELAAARLTVLSPEQLLGRLEDRFRLLIGGSRTALPRQQTLRATVEWSYDLLADDERALFDRLAVFSGGWTLEAAEAVGAGPEVAAPTVLDLLARLIDKSLVLAEEGPREAARYRLLETLRQYGRERLDARGETDRVRQQHAAFFEAFVSELAPSGPEQAAGFDQLEAEHDNLRAALRWAVDRGQAARGLRLGNALAEFWRFRGYLSEGRAWLGALLALPPAPAAAPERARGLEALAALARRQCDYAAARALLEERLTLARAGDDRPAVARCLMELGQVACQQGDYAAARRLLEESLAGFATAADEAGMARVRRILGQVALRLGEPARARVLLEESLPALTAAGDRLLVGYCLCDLGDVALDLGDHAAARARFAEAHQIASAFGDRTGLAYLLENFAYLAAAEARAERALRLAGAAAGLRERLGAPLPPDFQALSTRWLEPARCVLGEEAQAVAWAFGRAMPLETALAYALDETANVTP